MRLALSERALATWLVVPTAIVVILLGVVQYRWSEQVSSATTIRLADSLQMSMMSWHQSLYRAFSDICQRMVLPADSPSHPEIAQAALQFETQATAEYLNLVSSIEVLPADTTLPALRWNAVAHQFEPLPATAAVSALRDRLTSSVVSSSGARAAAAAFGGGLQGCQFDPEPLLLRAVPVGAAPTGSDPHSTHVPSGWLVIRLDDRVLSERVLPDLARRHFTGIDGLDYQVAVVTGSGPRHVIYTSDPAFGSGDLRDADGRLNIFGRSLDISRGSSIKVFATTNQRMPPPMAVTMAWFPLVSDRTSADDWQLVVRHRRDGALGAFVARTRRRDLAVSFSLLILLVLSMTVWLIVVNRAQRLARLQMNFVAAVSHDLRTPLTVIASAADNIARGIVREEGQLAQYGTTISRQANKLSGLVDRVLLFASSGESRRVSPQSVDLTVAIDTALEGASELIQTTHAVVERDIELGLPPVIADPMGLLQCLQNLITNAIKYGGRQPLIGISAILIHDERGPEIQVRIRDRGIGISPSDLRHIFTPFFRSPSIANEIRGTGLGLAVSRSVVEAMNGRLTVVSNLGEGSTFTIHIPCVPIVPS
jgi:signal transduction histidine kinase